MQHLKTTKHGYKYRTAPGPEGKAVEVSIYYEKGGPNYFSGGQTPRAIIASLTPITLKDGCVSFTLLSGKAIIVERLANYRPKVLELHATTLDAQVETIAGLALTDFAGGVELLKEVLTPQRVAEAPAPPASGFTQRTLPYKVRTGCGHIVIRQMREATAGIPFAENPIIEAPNGRPCEDCEKKLHTEALASAGGAS